MDVDDLSPTQIKINLVKQLIQGVADPKLEDDLYLLQWLKCHNMNAERAATGIQQSFVWRKHNHYLEPDGVLPETFPEELHALIPYNANGVSKEGVPIISLQVSMTAVATAVDQFGRTMVSRYFVWIFLRMERLMICFNRRSLKDNSSLSPTSSRGIFTIYNYQDDQASWSAMPFQGISLYTEVSHIFAIHFPRISDVIFAINCNSYFNTAVQVIRPFLLRVVGRLEVLGTNPSVWRPILLEVMEEAQLDRVLM